MHSRREGRRVDNFTKNKGNLVNFNIRQISKETMLLMFSRVKEIDRRAPDKGILKLIICLNTMSWFENPDLTLLLPIIPHILFILFLALLSTPQLLFFYTAIWSFIPPSLYLSVTSLGDLILPSLILCPLTLFSPSISFSHAPHPLFLPLSLWRRISYGIWLRPRYRALQD